MRMLARKWEQFVTGKDVDLGDLSPLIRDAWVRSRQQGVDPALPYAPQEEISADLTVLRATVDWFSCAEPVLDFLRSILTESHQLIMLGDKRGQVLHSSGGITAMTRAEELGAVPGGAWGENTVGCTVLGTSIHANTLLQVGWQENYCLNWKDWINQSAPIHDPITQEILGALGIAGYRELNHPKALALVLNAVGQIEANLREREIKARLLALEHFARLNVRYPSEGLIALDRRGYILAVNSTAEQILRLPYDRLTGERPQNLPALRDFFGSALLTEPTESSLAKKEPLPGGTIFPVSDDPSSGAVMLLSQPARPAARATARQQWPATYTFADLIGQHPRFRECLNLAAKVSQEDWPVLLLGESGTGKELLAQAIHNASPRRRGPFVVFSCAAIGPEMVGAELFGYTAGSFTGALKEGKAGKLQLAHGGTLFLDDVDGMPLMTQLSLLRVLEENRVVPLGGQAPQLVDIRVIAASNTDLEHAVRDGRFRHDLYYRLNVVPLSLPPLRERLEDIPMLTAHFLAQCASTVTISEEALQLLTRYSWPGNVRELRNVLLAASLHARNGRLQPSDLPAALARGGVAPSQKRLSPVPSLKDTEADLIARALQQAKSVPHAASLLGLHYSTLYRKIKRYGIARPPG
jgi:transcriptional regulator of acetoin/glycerol metabolism